MLTRLMGACALAFLATVGVHAQDRQDTPLPGQEGPPPAQQDRPSPPPDVRPPPQDVPARPPEPQQPRADTSPSRVADRCGAVAYTADGAFGAAYGMENCSDAERLAIEECRRESTDKDDCLRGVLVRKDTWFYVQFCRSGGEWTTNVTTKQTMVDVNNSAVEWASRSKYGAENCRLVPNGLFHSGGLHAKM